MRFVRKPKPYTSGLWSLLTWSRPAGRRSRPAAARPPSSPPRPLHRPASLTPPAQVRLPQERRAHSPVYWGQRSVTALALLGVLVVALIGGFAVNNQLNRDAQFAALGEHLAGSAR